MNSAAAQCSDEVEAPPDEAVPNTPYILMPVVRGGVFEVVTSELVWWFDDDYFLLCGVGSLELG